MADISAIRQTVLERLNEKRLKAEQAASLRAAEVRERIPEIARLDTILRSISLALFDGVSQKSMTVDEIRLQYRQTKQEKERLLVENGYPADYTRVKYSCEACGDTGFIGYRMCECAKKEIRKETVLSSGLGGLIDRQRFDNFSLDRYSDVAAAGKISDRARMENNLERCRRFAESFSREDPPTSLMLVGGTGLGKTHLSTAIAARVMERGFTVIYDSAANILSTIEKVQYGRMDPSDEQAYFDADLLIIDDLGTEFSGKNISSALFTLVNTRLNRKKPMIINTNLDPMALEQRYEQRIFSRFFGDFNALPFVGKDARMR